MTYNVVRGLTEHELHIWENERDLRVPLVMTMGWFIVRLFIHFNWRPEIFKGFDDLTVQTIHAKLLSSIHAAAAVGTGMYFLVGGELDKVVQGNRLFMFNEFYAMSSLFGISYFLYDMTWLVVKSAFFGIPFSAQTGIMAHHALFIVAFWIANGYPSVLSIICFSVFQLTELSTIFLNNHYMFIKLGIDGKVKLMNGILLLITFGTVRLGATAYCAYLVVTWLFFGTGDFFPEAQFMPLLSIPSSTEHIPSISPFNGTNQIIDLTQLPKGTDAYHLPFLYLFLIGCPGMLLLNSYWFVLLVKQAVRSPQNASEYHQFEKNNKKSD